jgi:acid phosphatase type 7
MKKMLLLGLTGAAIGLITGCDHPDLDRGDLSSWNGSAEQVAILVGAGDIAGCDWWEIDVEDPADLIRTIHRIMDGPPYGDGTTAAILDTVAGTVFTTGDHVYPDGTAAEFARCYEATWGRHRNRTRPSPGNHDYHTNGAEGYFGYFGELAGASGEGYYAYDHGTWRVIALNSNIDVGPGSRQLKWLAGELGSGHRECSVAYWHEPRFSSGHHGSEPALDAAWRLLAAAGVDIVVNGHDHNYERFHRQSPDGRRDDRHGLRQFVVGTGGGRLRPVEAPIANSAFLNDTQHGVLRLTLHPGRYEWAFIAVGEEKPLDSGNDRCHGPPSREAAPSGRRGG